MRSPHIYLIKKHLITNEEQLDIFNEGIPLLEQALERIEARQAPVTLGVKLSVPERQLQSNYPALLTATRDAMRKLPSPVFQLYDPACTGPGASVRMIVFNEAFSRPPSIVGHACYDQTLTHTDEALDAIIGLCGRMREEGSLMGVSLRDVPVTLGAYRRNSELRIIHELIHSITAGSEKLAVREHPPGVTPAYAAIGETTTGLSLFDFAHPKYAELAKCMIESRQRAPFTGFATDYYLAIKAAKMAPISRAYTPYAQNLFPGRKSEEEEFMSVRNLIYTQTKDLGLTDIVGDLRTTLHDPRTVERIAEFYDEQEVRYVVTLMRDALEDRS